MSYNVSNVKNIKNLKNKNKNSNKLKYILNSLPSIEVYNENKIHNKLTKSKFNYYRIIPKGRKGILVFTQENNNFKSYFIDIHKKKCVNVSQYNVCFNESLAYGKYGTILYGSFNYYNKQPTFIMEDVLYFKHNNLKSKNWDYKYKVMTDILSNYINPVILQSRQLLILSCVVDKIQGQDIQQLIDAYCSNYDISIYSIQFFNGNYSNVYTGIYKDTIRKTGTFKIKPHIQNDIYEAFDIYNNYSVGIISIPDYKTSIMMNKYFRNIKENDNLDLLEESDDDEEFENTNLDKYVYLEKTGIFDCIYDNSFKMWVPVKLSK